MTSLSRLLLPYVALVLLPLSAACFENEPVGSDNGDAGASGTGTGSGSGTEVCSGSEVCSEPTIPEGCHLGPGGCVDGVYTCPLVVCPGDAGTCSAVGVVCSEPPIPSGCSLGPSRCVDGVYECPAVICPSGDGGACTPPAGFVCTEPTVPPGCSVLPPSCVDGVYTCNGVVCPIDAGPSFQCGNAGVTCDPSSQYCSIVEGGPLQPDGGVAVNASCVALPAACGGDATCTCVTPQNLDTCTSTGNQVTVEENVP